MARLPRHVRWFDNAEGYGFIRRDGGPDMVRHFSSIHFSIEADRYKTLTRDEELVFAVRRQGS